MASETMTSGAPDSTGAFVPVGTWNPETIRADFPMLARRIRGAALAYLDNAATGLTPQSVIDEMARYYRDVTANVSRGVHTASQEATARYEAVREQTAGFLNAGAADEVVFTPGTTAGINLIAQSYGRSVLRPGDEILVSEMEHHSNLVPWQLIAEQTGARVRGIPITDAGDLDLAWLERHLTDRTKVVAVCHVSNVLGTVVPIAQVAKLAHAMGAVCVVDGAQAAPHLAVDLQALGCDFYVLSVHKLFGPTGLGVLWGRRALFERMPPWMGGGGMIAKVEIERSTFLPAPARFEAGTPPIAEVFGLGAVIDYLASWDRSAAERHERDLVRYATERLEAIPGVVIHGRSRTKVGLVTFTVDGVHPHDVGTALDAGGVAVRAGHHCAQPLMTRLGVPATVRASFAPYNTRDEVDALVAGVERAKKVFGQ